ncbi:MAG: hypothetical protein HKN23_13925 [Verrucomicrobiales bacterium]|nr:hypothetical protein [Verrucomicrobiales bacterium]
MTGSQIGGSLKVAKLADDAPSFEKVNVRSGRHAWRTNASSRYPNGDRAAEVSRAVARHIDKSGLFQSVVYPDDGTKADYKLTGRIYDYNAMGKVNKRAENILVLGSMFGSFPGAAAGLAGTIGQKTTLQSNVELRDLKIRSQKTNRLLWSNPSIKRSSNREVHFLKADKKPVYKEADRQLKNVVSEMIDDIQESHKKNPTAWKLRK